MCVLRKKIKNSKYKDKFVIFVQKLALENNFDNNFKTKWAQCNLSKIWEEVSKIYPNLIL